MATERWRAVLDTNVVIAALKSRQPASPTAELLRRWVAGEFEVIYSAALQAEYEEKIAARAIEPVRAAGFLADLQAHGVRIEVDTVEAVITADPDDDLVLACAILGGATHLVTYDPHFLPLGDRYRGVCILDGLHFLYLVRGDRPLAFFQHSFATLLTNQPIYPSPINGE